MQTMPTMTSEVKKLSFAKVAAAAKENAATHVPTARVPIARPTKQTPGVPAKATVKASVVLSTMLTTESEDSAVIPAVAAKAGDDAVATVDPIPESKIVDGLKDLKLDAKTPGLAVNGTESTATEGSGKTGNSRSPSDDVSQRADSNSELGTKPPSLDGKSITSGTTFALDEKESLRPDDSASVKAAAEDDDAFSIRGSFLPGSRMGSEIAARFRIQLGDMPLPTVKTNILSEAHVQLPITPQSGASDKEPDPDAKLPLTGAASSQDAFNGNGFYRQNPDEKLLEAMQSPKDRLFLLRLEKEVIEFVQDSKEPFMDLPPCNSFCRMLTHKLADYYHMTHSFEAVAGAVRIYRTPFCRVPPSLASIAVSASNGGTPPPAVLPRKIMRRGQDGELATASASPSKPTSEVGSDVKEKALPAKEKLTREEREEAYNRARERIFGSAEKTETSTPENEENAGVSRASSVSAKDKSNIAKKGKTPKQRRDDSDSFDTRSKYAPVYGPQQQTWVQPQYTPVVNPQFNGQFQQPYQNTMQPIYGPPPPNQPYSHSPIAPNSGYVPPFNNMASYTAQPTQQRYPPGPNVPMAPYGPPMQTVPPQAWQPNFTQDAYPNRAPPPTSAGIPYAFGQLPVNVNPNDPKSQHPIPGSYTRHAFNPKTQSFVPSNGMVQMQAAPGPLSGPSSHHSSPQMNPQLMNYNTYQSSMPQQQPPMPPHQPPMPQHQQSMPQQQPPMPQHQPSMPQHQPPMIQHQPSMPQYQPPMPQHQPPMPQQQQAQYGAHGTSYGMSRQAPSNTLPSYQNPRLQQLPPAPQHRAPHRSPLHHVPQNPPQVLPNKPSLPQGPKAGQPFSHLPTYGNPATLPQKPST